MSLPLQNWYKCEFSEFIGYWSQNGSKKFSTSVDFNRLQWSFWDDFEFEVTIFPPFIRLQIDKHTLFYILVFACVKKVANVPI